MGTSTVVVETLESSSALATIPGRSLNPPRQLSRSMRSTTVDAHRVPRRRSGNKNGDFNVFNMQKSLHVYGLVIRRRMFDHLSMLVHHGLIGSLTQRFQERMLQKFRQIDQVAPLMDPDPAIVIRREKLECCLKNCDAAMDELRTCGGQVLGAGPLSTSTLWSRSSHRDILYAGISRPRSTSKDGHDAGQGSAGRAPSAN